MKKTPSSLLLVLLLLTSASAQLPAQAIRWEKGATHSDSILVDGATVKTISADGITVAVVLSDTGWKVRADVYIENKAAERFDALPEQFTLEAVSPKRKPLPYQSADTLARSIDRRARWSSVLTQTLGAMATQQTTSATSTQGVVNATGNDGSYATGTYSGTATTTTAGPDYAARRRAEAQAAATIQDADSLIAHIHQITFKANTVMPGRSVFGAVFFERDKKANELILRVPAGGRIYEFPFRKIN